MRRKTQHNTTWVGHHYAHTNTKNVNKTCGLLQTTGGKVEPNIILLRKSGRTSKHVKTQNRTTQKKLKRLATQTQPKNRGWTQVLAKSKQFMLLIRHLSCYSYIQSSPVNVFADMNIIHVLHVYVQSRYWYFVHS